MKQLITIAVAWVVTTLCALGQGTVYRYDTLDSFINGSKTPASLATGGKLSLAFDGKSSRGDWGASRIARWVAVAEKTTNNFGAFNHPKGGQIIFDDVYSSEPIRVEWGGARPQNTTGWTNRLTWQQIAVDSRRAIQEAIDLKAAQGGGIVMIGPGEWRSGDDSNPGTIYLKPNVELVGYGAPKGDDSFEGTFASTNIMRSTHSTMIHFSGGSTNGYGAPCIVLTGSNYANQYVTSFTDLNGEWVSYYRGGTSIRNIGIYSGWKWAWNGSSAPAAAIFINEVAGTTIDNVWVGPTAGPGIYIRGGFGARIYNSVITTPLSSGIILTDTSDTIIDNCTISAARGASIAIHRANTHIIRNCSFWNNAEDLVGWTGTSQVVTNFTTLESSGVRRTGFTADPTANTITVATRIGGDTGYPVVVRGTSIPGGLDTNTVYYVRWGTQGGTSFYLTTSSGRALNPVGAVVDITSAGGTDTWWLEGPSGQVWLRDMEEVEITSLRADQSFSGIVDAARVVRSKFANFHAWEIGLNQTEVRQSRKQTWYDPAIIGIRLEDCHDITISGGQFIGSKANTSLPIQWDHIGYGVYSIGSADIAVSGNTFDRLNTAIFADGKSANISTDGNQFGGWVSRAVDSDSSYGITQHAPYFDGKTNSQIVASIPAALTNITGDFSVAIKARVPSMTTNGWANGRHSALFNLSTATNVSGQGALQPRCVQISFWRSSLDNSMNVVTTIGGTNYDQSNPSTERFSIGAGVTRFIGQDVEIVVQRSSGLLQIYVDGFLVNSQTINNSATGTLLAPYAVVGQFADSGQFSHPQAPIYSIAYHQQAFTLAEINKGLPWSRKSDSNAILYWDFAGASLAQGVFDLSGNGANGTVQQIGAVAPSFGLARDLVISSGSGITTTRTGRNSYSVAAALDTEAVQDVVGGLLVAGSNIGISYNDAGNTLTITGKTDEEIQDLMGATIIAGSNASVTYNDAGNTITIDGRSDESIQDLLSTTLVAGTNITLTYNDAGNTLTIASSGSGGGGGTNLIGVNGTFRSDWNFTNGARVQYSIASTTNVTPTLASGDWGDITLTGGTNFTIDAQSVTYADIQNVSAASRLLGRGSASGAGSPEEITIGSGLSLSGTTLSATGGSSTNVSFDGLTDGFTNGWAAGYPAVWHADGSIGPTNAMSLSTNYVGTIILTNALGVDSGGSGRATLTTGAYLAGNGTSPVTQVGPSTHAIAGWSNSTPAVITAGSNITITNGVISASGGSGSGETNTASNLGTQSATIQGLYNSKSGTDLRFRSLEAGSGITLVSNANTVAIVATGGGSFTVSTNNLGYLQRSAVTTTIQQTDGEVSPWTITIPANTLGVDGDEVKIHMSGILTIYNSGGDNGYSWRMVSDSSSVNVAELSTTNRYFSSIGDPARSLDWEFTIKRTATNAIFVTTKHSVGPGINLLNSQNASTNLVETTMTRATSFGATDLGSSSIDFSFYADIADDARAATMILYGYLVNKVGSLGQSNLISSVSSDLQVSGGTLSITNTTGTGALVRQSAVSAWDIDVRTFVTNTDSSFTAIYTNAVPDGQARLYNVDILAGGATNSGSFKLFGRVVNRGGTPSSSNWVIAGGSFDTNLNAYLTNSGTNALVMFRGPLYGPQAVNARGTIQIVTNAGAYAGASTLDTNGWLWSFQMDDTNWTSGPDPYALVLTPTNSPANITGVLSNAVRIQRSNNQILGMVTTNLVEVTTNMNWSLGAWVLLNSLPTSGQTYGIAGKTDPGVNSRVEYGMGIEYNASGGAPFFSTGTNASNSGVYKLTSANLVTATNVWTFIIAGRDATAGSNWISVAGAAKEWVASPIGPAPTATPFRVGSHGSATHIMNGNIDKVMFWRTNVSMTQIGFLTNNPPAAIP